MVRVADVLNGAASPAGDQGAGLPDRGIVMVFKLIQSGQRRWRTVNAPHLVALLRGGSAFANGQLVERPVAEQPADTDGSDAISDRKEAA